MITTTGIRPAAPRGTTRVPPSSRLPLLMVYGVSTTGGTVSAAWGAAMRSARLRTIMLLSLPEDVGLHHGNDRDDDDGHDEQRQKRGPREECADREDQSSEDHQQAAGAMRFPPHGVARQRPWRPDADEPVRLDAREIVAEKHEQQADAERHQAVDLDRHEIGRASCRG